jgi:hypothetical protein
MGCSGTEANAEYGARVSAARIAGIMVRQDRI